MGNALSCASQCCCCGAVLGLIPSCCFAGSRRRANPDLAAVPESPYFSPQWLTDALHSAGTIPAEVSVASVSIGEIILDMEGEELKNGGGLAGGKTVKVKEIQYSGIPEAQLQHLPTSCIEKHVHSDDVVPKDFGERAFMSMLLGETENTPVNFRFSFATMLIGQDRLWLANREGSLI